MSCKGVTLFAAKLFLRIKRRTDKAITRNQAQIASYRQTSAQFREHLWLPFEYRPKRPIDIAIALNVQTVFESLQLRL